MTDQSNSSGTGGGQTSDRQLLIDAQAKGAGPTLFAFFRLSGPGWLQSAITLGGGSLVSALFLGVFGGVSMLWVQLVAMIFGVIMLSAISYVTLSSKLRPFDAINHHINPVLGNGWLLATILANVIWCMPQFSLCFDALNNGIFDGGLTSKPAAVKQQDPPKTDPAEPSGEKETSEKGSNAQKSNASDVTLVSGNTNKKATSNSKLEAVKASEGESVEKKNPQTPAGTLSFSVFGYPVVVKDYLPKFGVSFVFLAFASTMVVMSTRGGAAAKWFDRVLKLIIGVIVLCFVGVVVVLSMNGVLDWGAIARGFIPNLNQLFNPSDSIAELISKLPEDSQGYWTKTIVSQQRNVMISAFATAVGLNMTFLLPYSLLARGWDRPFRGLARFDLVFGMLIPFILVTSCVAISAAAAFHSKADKAFLDESASVVQSSRFFGGASKSLLGRLKDQKNEKLLASLEGEPEKIAAWITSLPKEEKILACNLVKPKTNEMAEAMAPLFSGEEGKPSRLGSVVFSVGALAMGFSTIIILMLINGYAFAELTGSPITGKSFLFGIFLAGFAGFCWPIVWQSESKLWIAIVASTFGLLLLPIAYGAFILLINSSKVLGDQRPKGIWRIGWNLMLGVAFLGTLVPVGFTLVGKFSENPIQGSFVAGAAACFLALAVVGFFSVKNRSIAQQSSDG